MARPTIKLTNADIRDLSEAVYGQRGGPFKSFLSTLHFKAGYAIMKTAAACRDHMRKHAQFETDLNEELRKRKVEIAMTGPGGMPVTDAGGNPRTVFQFDFASAEDQREYESRVNGLMAMEEEIDVHTFDPKYLPDDKAHPDLAMFDFCWLMHKPEKSRSKKSANGSVEAESVET